MQTFRNITLVSGKKCQPRTIWKDHSACCLTAGSPPTDPSCSQAYRPPPAQQVKTLPLLLRTDKDPHIVPSAATAAPAPGASTAGRTAFPSHTSSHTATGRPGKKPNQSELGAVEMSLKALGRAGVGDRILSAYVRMRMCLI